MASMPADPNQSMDQQLRAYAEHRRHEAGGPFRLPPDQRHRLLDEVQRQFRPPGGMAAAEPSWWRLFWPYLALGGSAFAALVVCFLIWREDNRALRSATRLAKAEPRAAAAAPSRPAAPLEPPAEKSVDDRLAPPPPASKPAPEREARADRYGLVGPQPATAPPPPATLPPPPPVAVASGPAPKVAAPVPAEPRALAEVPPASALAAQAPVPAPALAPAPAPTSPAPDALARGGAAAFERRADTTVSRPEGIVALRREPTKSVAPPPAPVASPAARSLPAQPQEERLAARAPGETRLAGRRLESAQGADGSMAAGGRFGPGQQRFAQLDADRALRRNFNSPARPRVLQQFQLEQVGDRVRITDADGSVYEGPIQPRAAGQNLAVASAVKPSAPRRAVAEPAIARAQASQTDKRAAAPADGDETAGGEEALLFTAIGTNQSTGQPVVFSGRVVVTNVAANRTQANQSAAPSSFRAVLGAPLELGNAVVQGQATIGRRTQIEINAVPVGP